MSRQKSELYFLLVLLVAIFILAFFIFKPFLYAIILAIIFATVFKPFHARVLSFFKGRHGFAAITSALFVLIIIVTPVIYLGTQIFEESSRLYVLFTQSDSISTLFPDIEKALNSVRGLFPTSIDFSVAIDQYVRTGLNNLVQHLGGIFANVARAIVSIFVFLVALYYLFKDGSKLKKAVIKLSPLNDTHDEFIFKRLTLAINSVVRGNLAIAIIQGILTTIGFSIFGIPNAVLWGSLAAFAALIPGIGTALVIFPAIVYLFLTGQTFPAVGLLVWGVIAVGLIDNVLGPYLVERGIQIHPFLVLLSILGGLVFFGPLGFLLGPIVLSLLFALLEIYFTVQKEYERA